MDIELRVRLAIAKGRNIIYYRTIDTRARAVYMHVLRDFRQLLVELLQDLPENHSRVSFFQSLIDAIDPKVKTEECTQTIIEMQKLYENEQF